MKPAILIVDDSLTVRMDLVEAFEAAGFAPTPCSTAAEARASLAAGSFRLIIVDVLLPDADGIDLAKEFKSSPGTAGIPIMCLSSEAEVGTRARGLQSGADEYIGKPYDPAYVIGRARELVRRQGPEPTTSDRPTILLIDDSLTFREELKATLESAGYDVATAVTGEEGLRLAANVRPGAVIVDRMLPGIDGAGVVRQMRLDAALRGTPCLLLTASEERSAELEALDAGADAFVRKDEDRAVILARLGAILRSARSPQAMDRTASFLGPKRILAVDDSLTYLHELAAQLRDEGYDVVLAHSGEDALEMLAVQPIDCVLLDLIMPGLSGQETCRRIKRSTLWRDIPLVMLTAHEELEAMIEGINAGADDYITKSADFKVLKARLRAQLRRKQFEDEHRGIRETLLRKEIETAEARAAQELAETRAALVDELEQKNRELEAFSYSVSHDLRAPLRHISGFAELLLRDHASQLDEKGRPRLSAIAASAHRMGQMIDDLLAFSRMGRTELQRSNVDLNGLMQGVLEDLEEEARGRRIRWIIGRLPEVEGDPSMLRLALINLIGNAIKYTGTREEAVIEVGVLEDSPEGAVVFVRDNGVGFDMEYAGKLFGVFQRLHLPDEFPGTGIGLANVRRIIQRNGGKTWAEGAVDQGATFYFSLPSVS